MSSTDTCHPSTEITRSNIKEITPKLPSVTAVKTKSTALPSDSRRQPFDSRDFIERQLVRVRALLAGRWPGTKTERQAVFKATENCDNPNGTINVTYRDTNNDRKLSVNDKFIFHYQHCQDNALGITADGQLALRVTEVAGDVVNEISPYTFAGKFDFNELNVINDGTHDRSIIKGDVDFRLSTHMELSKQKVPSGR